MSGFISPAAMPLFRLPFGPTLAWRLTATPTAVMDITEATGFTVDFLGDIASGEREPNEGELAELCAALGLSPDGFYSVEGDA